MRWIGLIAALAAACCAVAHADAPQPLRLTDIFEMQTAISPQLSPDGARIVYVRQFADIMTDKRYSNLWIVGFDGSNPRPLTTGKRSDTNPRWSPDGTRILFTAPDEAGATQLFVRWIDSADTAQITN